MSIITEKDLNNNPIFKNFNTLSLQPDEYVIMGSGIMFALGIRDLSTLDDIDLLVTKKGWDKVKDLSDTKHNDDWGCNYVQLFDKTVEAFDLWGPGEYNIDEIIKNAFKVGKYNFASPETIIRWKKEMGRDKDFGHIKLIEDYLKQ